SSRRPMRGVALSFFASALLAACSTAPPVGVNEPPDALDRVRSLDLQPRGLEATANVNTASPAEKPLVYYGSSGTVVPVDANSPNHDPNGGGGGGGEGVTLNFEDTPVSAVAKVILGDYLGVGYAIDPRVQGTISLSSGRPVPKSQLLFILESALRTSNAVLVHDAGGYRIVPADDAIGNGRVDRVDSGDEVGPGYGLSVVPLQHVSVQTITKLLESFATKPGAIRADPSKNLIIVVGNGIERRTAVDTILSFDADWMQGQSVGVFPVHNTTPEPLVTELEKILDSGDDGLSQHLVKLQPIARMNAVLVVARKPGLLRAAEKWINRLDASAVASTGVKVYKVRYGDCKQIAKLLSDLFIGTGSSNLESPTNQIAPGAGATTLASANGNPGQTGLGGGGSLGGGAGNGGLGSGSGLGSGGGLGGGAGGGLGAGQPQGGQNPFGSLSAGAGHGASAESETSGTGGTGGGLGGGGGKAILPGVRILPDIPNNSVVVYANAETYRIIERALNQLDRPQAQVAVDVTIAEVDLNNTLNYGVQFFIGHTLLGSGSTTGTTSVTGADGVFNSSGTSLPLSPTLPGFNAMIGSSLTPHVVISALNQYTTTKILSNPSLVVLDNQKASLLVGQQVPVSTGTANVLNSATSTSNTVFNSISYQNTGIILRFQPHVHANGNVNLEIDQEISAEIPGANACAGSATGGAPCPTFTDRHVTSSIQVPNGQTVLLAGLIQEEHDKSRSGIPLVDQIPFVGEAFSPSNDNEVHRTELIIFIRPQIIRDGVDASNVAEELRSKMRGDKVGTMNPPGSVAPYPIGLVQ
ncbi:MAG TPA: type II secretion system secretin GspD, partial [Tepidisphaeraceae bacterium]|nr:type II secretion system secretin GspD [Tepidisphaeraceae bacterium]